MWLGRKEHERVMGQEVRDVIAGRESPSHRALWSRWAESGFMVKVIGHHGRILGREVKSDVRFLKTPLWLPVGVRECLNSCLSKPPFSPGFREGQGAS